MYKSACNSHFFEEYHKMERDLNFLNAQRFIYMKPDELYQIQKKLEKMIDTCLNRNRELEINLRKVQFQQELVRPETRTATKHRR